jgi:hypothetical protein
MKLIITLEKIKDKTKKVKQAMIVTYINKEGKKLIAINELEKGNPLLAEFDNMIDQMKQLAKEKAKADKLKAKKTNK